MPQIRINTIPGQGAHSQIGPMIEQAVDLLQVLVETNANPEVIKSNIALVEAAQCLNKTRDESVGKLTNELVRSLGVTMGWIQERDERRGEPKEPQGLPIDTEHDRWSSSTVASEESHDDFDKGVEHASSEIIERNERGAWSDDGESDDDSEEDEDESAENEEDVENVGATERKKSSAGNQSWTCDECAKTFTTAGTLRVHKLTHLDDYTATHPYSCDQCEKRFTQAGSLSVHRRKHMDKNDPRLLKFKNEWKCDICHRHFRQRCSLYSHKKTHLGKDNEDSKRNVFYQCQFCDKRFASWQGRQRHERLHTGELPYKCEQCPRAYAAKTELNRHIKYHEKGTSRVVNNGLKKEKKHKCSLCPRRFWKALELGAHMKRHAEDTVGLSSDEEVAAQAFKCAKCPKQFDTFPKLSRHEIVHGGFPYPCPRCDREFRRPSTLAQHMLLEHGVETEQTNTVTKPRPFTCAHCPATFTTEFALEKHKEVHAGPSSFKCSRCSDEFATFALLEDHKRSVHDPLPYKCKHCGKRVRGLGELVKHKSLCDARLTKKTKKIGSTPLEIMRLD